MVGFDRQRGTDRVVSLPAGSASLAALRGEPLSSRFHGWRGASGRRYVTSIYPVDLSASDAGLPDFAAFVLVCVSRAGDSVRSVWITTIEQSADRRHAIARGLAEGAGEWHVHLLAGTRCERAAVTVDLIARHAAPMPAALSA